MCRGYKGAQKTLKIAVVHIGDERYGGKRDCGFEAPKHNYVMRWAVLVGAEGV